MKRNLFAIAILPMLIATAPARPIDWQAELDLFRQRADILEAISGQQSRVLSGLFLSKKAELFMCEPGPPVRRR
jgi:hypothetical protein